MLCGRAEGGSRYSCMSPVTNLFVIQGISRSKLGDVVRGAMPYYLIILAFVALLALVPEIALWLPNNMPTL